MEPIYQLISVIGKVASLTGILVYLIFAILVIRQVSMMTKVVHSPFSLPLRIFSWIHLAFSLFLFLLALVIL